jgi:hypothetical protein
MKIRISAILLISFLAIMSAGAQSTGKISTTGTWKFEAPYAPEGYSSGTIVVGVTENKPSATMSFTGSEFKLPGEKVKAVKDSVLFNIYLEGQDIQVFLKAESETKMSGKAVYSEGEVPLTLTKVVSPS